MFEFFTEEKFEERYEKIFYWLETTALSENVKNAILIAFTSVEGAVKGALEAIIIIGSIWGYIQVYKHFRKK